MPVPAVPDWGELLLDYVTSDVMHGYARLPIPAFEDAAVIAIVELYAFGAVGIRDRISPRAASVFGAFAERMATMAVRENSKWRCDLALLGLDLSENVPDIRDRLISFAPVRDAAHRIGSSPNDLPSAVSPGFRTLWNSFLIHVPETVLDSFNFELVNDPVDGMLRYSYKSM